MGFFIRRCSGNNDEESREDTHAKNTVGEPQPKKPPSRNKIILDQIIYILVFAFGAMVVFGSLNFAIAWAMYETNKSHLNANEMHRLTNTLSADSAVTIFSHCCIAWSLVYCVIFFDLGRGRVQPITLSAEPSNRVLRWFFLLQGKKGTRIEKFSPNSFAALVQHSIRAFIFVVVSIAVFWSSSRHVLRVIGHREGDGYRVDAWICQVYKMCIGGFVGFFMAPTMAIFWLMRGGWEANQYL